MQGLDPNYVRRLEDGECDPQTGLLFVEILHNLERIGRSCQATPKPLGRFEEPITAVNIAGDVLLI